MYRLSIVQTLTIESLEDIGRCASREAFEQDRLGAEADRKTGGMIVMGGAAALAARSRPVPAQALDDLLGANRCVAGACPQRNSYRRLGSLRACPLPSGPIGASSFHLCPPCRRPPPPLP